MFNCDQILEWMLTFLLLSGFMTVIFYRFQNILACYRWQSLALGVATGVMGYKSHEPHLYMLAIVALVVKGFLIPAGINKSLKGLAAQSEEKVFLGPAGSLFVAAGILLLSHAISRRALPMGSPMVDELTVTLTLLLLGLLFMIISKKATTQMMGILFMENAVTAAGVLMTGGMSIVVELGIMFDVLIGILVMSILVFRIQTAFSTIDTDELSSLHG